MIQRNKHFVVLLWGCFLVFILSCHNKHAQQFSKSISYEEPQKISLKKLFDSNNNIDIRPNEYVNGQALQLQINDEAVNVNFNEKVIPALSGNIQTDIINSDNGIISDDANQIRIDKKGQIWTALIFGYFTMYDGTFVNNFVSSNSNIKAGISMCVDHENKIWVSTVTKGIYCYDGYSIKHWTEKDGLAENNCQDIFEDSKGNIWVTSSSKGITCLSKKGIKTYNPLPEVDGYSSTQIFEDSKGNIWFGTDVNSILKFDGNTFKIISKKDGFDAENAFAFTEDEQGKIWVCTSNQGIYIIDSTHCYKLKHQDLKTENINSAIKDSSNNIWISTADSGLYKFSSNKFYHYTKANGLPTNLVYDMAIDKNNNIWCLSAGNGMFKVNANWVNYINIPFQNENCLKKINAIVKTKANEFWMTLRSNEPEWIYQNYNTSLDNNNAHILRHGDCLLKDSKSTIWYCYNDQLIHIDENKMYVYDNNQGFKNFKAKTLIEDSKGQLWKGDVKNGVCYFDGKSFKYITTEDGLLSNEVNTIFEDSRHQIWIGTMAGLSCISENNLINYTASNGYLGKTVNSIREDKNGNLWIGTESEGLFRYDGKSFLNYKIQQGISSNSIRNLITIDSAIWIGTSNGLSYFKQYISQKDTKKWNVINAFKNDEIKEYIPEFININKANDFVIKDVMQGNNTMLLDSNQTLWVATFANSSGLVKINIKHLFDSIKPANVSIRAIQLNDNNIDWPYIYFKEKKKINDDSLCVANAELFENIIFGKKLSVEEHKKQLNDYQNISFDSITPFTNIPVELKLPHKYNNIKFEFVSIETNRPKSIRYQYYLEGFEETWKPETDKTTVSYTNLFEGDYTLHIKSKIYNNNFSDETVYHFTISPPWYRTWWAYFMYSLCSLSIIAILFRIRTNVIRNQNKQLEKDVQIRTQEILIQKRKAEEALSLQEHFLANTSHEIRTPMNGILGMIRQMNSTSLQERQKKIMHAIDTSSRNLLQVVNDVLDISKIRSNTIVLKPTHFNIIELVENIERLFAEKVAEKNLTYKVEIANEIPTFLFGDDIRLNQILVNLIGNAIKFTQEGSVKLQIKTIQNDKENCELQFSITDTGIGILSERQKFIFQPFAQADDEIGRDFGGTGLGLSICKSLIEMQGGKLTLNSTIHKGSCFQFSLNYQIGKEIKKDIKQVQPINDLSHLNILLVEDNEINEEITLYELAQWNIKYDSAQDATTVFEKIKHKKFDLILMDIYLPGMNGIEISKKIRTEFGAHYQQVPIIALSASILLHEKTQCFEAGMNGFLAKPFEEEELLNLILEWAKVENIQKVKAELKKLTMGDHLLEEKMLNLFANQMPNYLNQVVENAEQLKWSDLKLNAHRMRGAISLYKLKEIELLLLDIENGAMEENPQKSVIEPLIIKLKNEVEEIIRQINKK